MSTLRRADIAEAVERSSVNAQNCITKEGSMQVCKQWFLKVVTRMCVCVCMDGEDRKTMKKKEPYREARRGYGEGTG